MAKNNQFTHGGSHGKNAGLILRSLCCIISFGLLWFGLFGWVGKTGIFGLSNTVFVICAVLGGLLTLFFLVTDLIGPFRHRKK